MKTIAKKALPLLLGIGAGLAMASSTWAANTLDDVMKARGLTQKDILAAAKTYTPTGGRDEYLAFASGGQSGHVIVYGIPSMRILKYIGVFTPEPWQAYGFDDESKKVLRQGNIKGAFAVRDPEKIAGRKIVLVDDVYTTGSTVNECARVLMNAGAEFVDVLTLARAV